MKPDIENSTPKKDDIALEVSMLSEEAFRLEKQKKQEELIKKANEQRQDETIEIKPGINFNLASSEDYLSLINSYLENNNIEPLKESEINLIVALRNDFSEFNFREWILTGKSNEGTLKNLIRIGRVSSIVKKIVIPRIRDSLKKYFLSGDNDSD